MTEKVTEWKKIHVAVLLLLVFAGSLIVLSFVGYSDGDDTFFFRILRQYGAGRVFKMAV